ncbi:hypothetical protein BpHYR1_014795 [Brachionus plicatilis]|uniref:Transmembrane protein n=1 Tax=Brachionus plicatilis TaxID=10195 RepID=A0A3M7SSP6_BRAPC|nr:hypothetical protein BpHYR1_014795 [Brachionus plicatilis]
MPTRTNTKMLHSLVKMITVAERIKELLIKYLHKAYNTDDDIKKLINNNSQSFNRRSVLSKLESIVNIVFFLVLLIFYHSFGFCEVQYKRTEQGFKINSVNREWCNIQIIQFFCIFFCSFYRKPLPSILGINLKAQTQRFQLSGRYVLNDLNSQLQSQPRPQDLVQNTRPRPQPVVNNTDSQENTAFRFFSFFTHRINSKIGRILNFDL